MPNFDSNGVLVAPLPPTQAEQDAMYAYAKIADPSQNGLALSQLRPPASKVSLQRVEQTAAALVLTGKLVSSTHQNEKGGTFRTYSWK